MTEPLPCPFCGHVGVSVVQTDTHKWRAAQCNECGAQSGDVRWIYTEEDPDASAHARALEEWNKRHPTTPQVSLTNHMEHPITPPPELVQQWDSEAATADMPDQVYIATQATRWGADQELEACCEWLEQSPYGFSVTANDVTDQLRAARRPRPPTLKQQASDSLDEVVKCLKMLVPGASVDGVHIETIRRALESLSDPQG